MVYEIKVSGRGGISAFKGILKKSEFEWTYANKTFTVSSTPVGINHLVTALPEKFTAKVTAKSPGTPPPVKQFVPPALAPAKLAPAPAPAVEEKAEKKVVLQHFSGNGQVVATEIPFSGRGAKSEYKSRALSGDTALARVQVFTDGELTDSYPL